MLRAALLLSLAACNQVYGLDPTTVQKMDAREPCIAGTPFGDGIEVPIAGNNSVEAARFMPNRDVAFLSLCTPGGSIGTCELYTSLYSRETETFGAFQKLAGISVATAYDTYPSVTRDNRFLLFASSRGSPSLGLTHIFVAESVEGSFDMPSITQIPGIPEYANEPFLVSDRVLYFSVDKTGSRQLARMEGAPPAFGGAYTMVEGTNLDIEVHAPVVREDEREIFYAAGSSIAGLDIYGATRASTSEPFAPVKVDSVSTPGIDYPVWIAPDGCELYYVNKQDGVAKLFVAKR